jgi:ABC-2 type transport system permease protein
MTAAVLPAPIAAGRDTRPGLGRLTLVELRKMTDTRAGFWLQLAVIGLTIAVAGLLVGFGEAQDQTFENMLQATMQPSANLLPIIGILLVSSEWSQRTAQQTFTLVPRRPRVIGAKLLASLVVAVAAFLVSVVVALLATAIAGTDAPGAWSLPAGELGQIALLLAIAMVGGVAFGALLLASAPAIVAYILAPIAWAALLSIPAFDAVAPWLDGSRSYAPMTEGVMSVTQWAHVGTTTALWLALPLALGLARITRSEVP